MKFCIYAILLVAVVSTCFAMDFDRFLRYKRQFGLGLGVNPGFGQGISANAQGGRRGGFGQNNYGNQGRDGGGRRGGFGQDNYGSQGRGGFGQNNYGSQGRGGFGQNNYGSQGRGGFNSNANLYGNRGLNGQAGLGGGFFG
uniref:Glycine-rich cell wall structural protein-like n=1 Tax=Rhabditophanes sp. KR3021 TaxID=114890 RepID=A0AC35UBJ3_9BILA